MTDDPNTAVGEAGARLRALVAELTDIAHQTSNRGAAVAYKHAAMKLEALLAAPVVSSPAKEALHAVKAMWTHWRLSLDRHAFSHSDGIRFLRMLDEYEANLILPTAPVLPPRASGEK